MLYNRKNIRRIEMRTYINKYMLRYTHTLKYGGYKIISRILSWNSINYRSFKMNFTGHVKL